MREGVKEGLTEEIVERRSEGGERESHVSIWGRALKADPIQCKGPDVRVYLVFLNKQEGQCGWN